MTSNTHQADVFNSATSSRTASVNPSSSVRPRNRRLISLATDDDDDAAGSASTDNATTGLSSDNFESANSLLPPSAPRSRAGTPSPNPSRQSSRTPTGRDRPASRTTLGNGWTDSRQNKPISPFVADFWESSWSSLQGLASTVLGNDDGWGKMKSSSPAPGRSQHRRKPSKANFVHDARTGPSSWGPTNFFNKQLGSGSSSGPMSQEERQSMVQALKRQTLLQANGDATPDSQGNYKRRDSGDAPRGSSAPPPEQDDSDALVYVHHVHKDDSITGVSIRYGCQPAVMRKANGFWPSDSIQARKTVLLPVEACTLKGRRLPDKEEDIVDLLDDHHHTDDPFMDSSPSALNCKSSAFGYGDTSSQSHYPGSAASSISGKGPKQAPPWKHECWVQVDGFWEPVEIGRVPRRTLGFFPRARRKSIVQELTPYSDSEDLDSRPISQDQPHNASRPSRPAIPASSTSPPYLCPSNSGNRTRDRSISSTKRPPSHRHRGSFTLSGPGGVGTMGRNVRAPGPAEDKLNHFINTHLPHLAVPPPPPQPPTSSPANYNYPRTSTESTSTVVSTTSSTTGLENVGGAIEGWMRKMARSAKAGVNELQQQGAHLGDLIELDDTPDGKGEANGGARNGNGSGRGRNMDYRSPTRASSGSGTSLGGGDSIRGRRMKGD
ncbi:hypothetical protein AJ79_06439 [Helicocarpus griseus UAMH5409]|uniref:LysM domain-containing protein n=1 Tax=Helicocarpus griseus UAMH5409 TaxID=1447875 RepID=A0A2B7XDR4_9EURO|nr:hypothetical protein AJ79_06439 [Helicocarpus griseus UAMH5409]